MMGHTDKTCPQCAEAVKSHWALCPACETRLPDRTCPGCGTDIKAHWVICPECHRRLAPPQTAEKPEEPLCTKENHPDLWTEPLSGIQFIRVTGGSFMMGDDSGEGLENEGPVHEVLLDEFYLARTPVTQNQWERVTGCDAESTGTGPDHPVTFVDYDEIRSFFRTLNDHHKTGHHFSLPTEAQWEYAARSGGKKQRYSGSDTPDAVAWFGENSDGFPHAVALKKPNSLGLYDMSGNVWEWCRDVFSESAYQGHDHHNPVLDSDMITDRVARGGNFLMDAWSLRCTRRFSFPETVSGKGLGFRPVMMVP